MRGRPGSQYDVAVTRGADNVLASDCRARFGRLSTRIGRRICVTVRLPVRLRRETMCWQANANTPLSVTPLLNVPSRVEICWKPFQQGIRTVAAFLELADALAFFWGGGEKLFKYFC